MGWPVARSQTIVVSRWFVMPTAATSRGAISARPSASTATEIWDVQISVGSCSTQPARGKICGNSRWATARIAPPSSKTMARELVVPWSRARTWAKALGPAGVGIAALDPLVEPLHALLRGAVGERLGLDVALGLALQPVVADGGGRAQPLLHVSGLEEVLVLVGVVRPHPGQAVRLELQPHRVAVGLLLRSRGAL